MIDEFSGPLPVAHRSSRKAELTVFFIDVMTDDKDFIPSKAGGRQSDDKTTNC